MNLLTSSILWKLTTVKSGFKKWKKTIASGNDVQLVGFGTFSVSERASREGRNPATGETMTIPAKKVVKFKPGKALSDAAASVKKTNASKSTKPKQTEKKK